MAARPGSGEGRLRTIIEAAPAKVNLCLHVTGRRADGYHLLDSLVVFPALGDRLSVEPGTELSLAMDGPFAGALGVGPDNLVLRAAEALRPPDGPGAALTLEKNLPLASGIGGGSADAAAALKLLSRFWDVAIPDALPLTLGADVPVCMAAPRAQWMRGIGDLLSPAPALPAFWLVLVNPMVPVETAAVFAGLDRTDGQPVIPPPPLGNVADLRTWLTLQRNDLEAPARAVCPAIDVVLAALKPAGLARMSGSGATCFGLAETESEALALAERIRAAEPRWWVAAGPVASNGPPPG